MNVPINAANPNNDPIQAASFNVGTAGNGDFDRSFNLGLTGDVQPRVVPTAKLERFAAQ